MITSLLSPSLRIAVLALPLAMLGCTVTETVKNFLSSTSPGTWYTQDGLPKAEHKLDIFMALNMENLKTDLARGQGEYLAALSTLLQVPPQRETEFFALAQQRYTAVAREDRVDMSRTLISLSRQLHEDLRSNE